MFSKYQFASIWIYLGILWLDLSGCTILRDLKNLTPGPTFPKTMLDKDARTDSLKGCGCSSCKLLRVVAILTAHLWQSRLRVCFSLKCVCNRPRTARKVPTGNESAPRSNSASGQTGDGCILKGCAVFAYDNLEKQATWSFSQVALIALTTFLHTLAVLGIAVRKSSGLPFLKACFFSLP